MSLLRQPASSIGRDILRLAPTVRAGQSQTTLATFRTPWTCWERTVRSRVQGQWLSRRHFLCTTRRRDERPDQGRIPIDPIITKSPTYSEPSTPASSSSSLPSHTANQRSEFLKQASKFLDGLLARASVASQHINAYTGTDYSAIEALRKEIIEQEQKVKSLHSTVDEAKAMHHEAYAKQTSAQREIVGLLERKSSWSPSDLDRYTSLVRSEHLNDKDVQVAKENLTVAERNLEEARSLLERLERKQYHEEQVWSDTIRRNSTWVTFGLMGVNIVLLLAQIAIFEPYRRKKIVRDVKNALDEKTLIGAPASAESEKLIDAAIPPENLNTEQVEKKLKQSLDRIVPISEKNVGTTPLSVGEVLLEDASEVTGPDLGREGQHPQALNTPLLQPAATENGSNGGWGTCQATFRDLFSKRLIQMRKVDVTNTALQGAATGMAVMGLLFVLLWPE